MPWRPLNDNFVQEFPRNLQLLRGGFGHGEKPVGIKAMQVLTWHGRTWFYYSYSSSLNFYAG